MTRCEAGTGGPGSPDAAPPPGATILGISGLRVPADQVAVQAAIRRADPSARIWTDWAEGKVAIASARPAAAFRDAVRALGYQAEIQAGTAGRRTAGIFGRMLLYAVLGGVLGFCAGVVLGLANSALNPDCTRPGSSGGCAIGVGLLGMLFGALGIPAGALAGLIHGLVRPGC